MPFIRLSKPAVLAVHPAGAGQGLATTQLVQAQAFGMRTGGARRSRRSRPARKAAAAPRRARKSSRRPARLVKGSAAAKRYMASIRRKRR